MKVRGSSTGIRLGNFLSLGAGEVGARCIAFFATAFMARRLGTEGFGVLGFAAALTSYLVIAPSVGLQDLAAREVARRPGDAPRIASGVIAIRLLMGAGGFVLICVLAALLPKPAAVKAAVALSGLSLFPLALNISWAYKALNRTRRVSTGVCVGQAVFAAGVLLLIHGPADLLRVPVLQAVGELAAAVLLLPLLRGRPRGGVLREGAMALRGAKTITMTRLFRTFIVTSDVVLLSFLADDRQVGLYSAAYRICFLLTAIAVATHVVFLPALSQHPAHAAPANEVLSESLWLSWTVSLPFVIGGIVIAPDLMALLFGPEFHAGGQALRVLLIGTGLLFLHGTLHNVFLANNRLSLEMAIIAVAAGANLVLNLLLIPRYGIVGSAFATAMAEAVILMAGAKVLARWGWRPALGRMVRPTVAAAMMAGALLVTPRSVHIMARMGLGGLSYMAGLWLTGGLPPQLRRTADVTLS